MSKRIIEIIQAISDNLSKGGILKKELTITEDTVLMGVGTDFDSISFVTLFMELEEKVSELAGDEVYLVLDVINTEDSELTVGALVRYIEQLLENA